MLTALIRNKDSKNKKKTEKKVKIKTKRPQLFIA
jgi:hypothetical protein